MATLQEIENLLDIEIGDKKLRNGRKYTDKNKYYRYDNYYIVSLTRNKWMIIDNDRKNRKLLKKYCWNYHHTGYATTAYYIDNKQSSKYYHQLLLNYEQGLVADHINRCKFDNRTNNLRIVIRAENNKNRPIQSNNTTGISGIYRRKTRWVARINDINGCEISKSFSLIKYGEEEAKRLAIEQRNAWKIEFGYIGE